MGKVHGHFALVNIANINLLRSYHEKSVWSFCISLCSVCLLFCASGISLCTLGCPAVLTWLCLQVQSKCIQIHVLLFFTVVKQLRSFPTICSNPCATAKFNVGSQQLLSGQHWEQYSRWRHGNLFPASRPRIMHHMFPTHAQKAFNFELWLFQKCKGSVRTNEKFCSWEIH